MVGEILSDYVNDYLLDIQRLGDKRVAAAFPAEGPIDLGDCLSRDSTACTGRLDRDMQYTIELIHGLDDATLPSTVELVAS
jgi:hypothetical protein